MTAFLITTINIYTKIQTWFIAIIKMINKIPRLKEKKYYERIPEVGDKVVINSFEDFEENWWINKHWYAHDWYHICRKNSGICWTHFIIEEINNKSYTLFDSRTDSTWKKYKHVEIVPREAFSVDQEWVKQTLGIWINL